MLNACGSLKRDHLPQSNGEKASLKGLEKDEMEILYLASLAPSGHNTQPWVVRILEPNHWVIGSDKKRWLPAVDPENRELLLGIGAFIENLVLAAGTFGYEVDIQIAQTALLILTLQRFGLKKVTPSISLLKKSERGEQFGVVTRIRRSRQRMCR